MHGCCVHARTQMRFSVCVCVRVRVRDRVRLCVLVGAWACLSEAVCNNLEAPSVEHEGKDEHAQLGRHGLYGTTGWM